MISLEVVLLLFKYQREVLFDTIAEIMQIELIKFIDKLSMIFLALTMSSGF